jgi:hypothetical protein
VDSTTVRCCSKCHRSKNLLEFSHHSHQSSGYRSECKACQRKRNQKWREDNPDRYRAILDRAHTKRKSDPVTRAKHSAGIKVWRKTASGQRSMLDNRLRHDYGITLEEYTRLLDKQKGLCAICGKPPKGGSPTNQRLHVDHNHTTGKVRGLLCKNCNTAIGFLGEDLSRIEASIRYLRSEGSQVKPIPNNQGQDSVESYWEDVKPKKL